ncbi:MAG: crosslink repair DNA glycosylase YcaQ family protein [Chloroflexota bacterium]
MAKVRRISNSTARRIVIAAQGFLDPRPSGKVTRAHLRRALSRIGMLQIDSVNVLVRSHYLPLFSRLGPYPVSLLDDLAYKRRELFEYWGHEASLIPIERYPLFRERMDNESRWHIHNWASEHQAYVQTVLEEVRAHGPIVVGQLSDARSGEGGWWGWGEGKLALEYLFARGLVTTAGRSAFARMYDVTERVIPATLLNEPTPSPREAQAQMLLLAARSAGVGSVRDIADYYRLPQKSSLEILREFVASGALESVEVEGWRGEAFLHPGARAPRKSDARALLSPFDSLVWERDRTERLFGFRYRIEIYTPQPKRVFGYYVLPFLLGERLVGRVDLKSDRQAGQLLVRATHAEEGVDHDEVAPPLAEELRSMAGWLGLGSVVVSPVGNLADALGKQFE